MKHFISICILFLLSTCTTIKYHPPDYVLVIHGGAGVMDRKNFTSEAEQAYLDKLQEALDSGEAILKNGGSALDAVTAVVVLLEDSPMFNAGRGSVFSETGENEMDASIMSGTDLSAGAVAGVRTIKNPILAARAVMEQTKHVLLVRDGAGEIRGGSGPGDRRSRLVLRPEALRCPAAGAEARHRRRGGARQGQATWPRPPPPAV
jgi:L-asparaginase / beta-aspartyl-peptidase